MYYELVNPSDPVTFQAPDLKIAALVTLILGHGQFAANPEDENAEGVPLMLFGGAEEWWNERFQEPMENAGDRDRERLAIALRSVCYGSTTDRKLYDSALLAITDPEKRAGFIAEWNDRHRSSMNNIMGRAHSIAERLEQPAAA
jgi:hypothetical protein